MNDYSAIVEERLDVVLKSGDEWMCKCPEHEDRTASLQFNVKKGLWVCFSCGRTGNAKTLFGDGLREPEPDIESVIAQLDLIESTKSAAPPTVDESILRRFNFPTDYWSDRGLSSRIIKAFQLGYDPIEDDAIIPVRHPNGGLIGVIRRRLENDYGPKYMYPKHFPRKTTMFGAWMIEQADTDHVAVVEGSVDCMAVWDAGTPAVAQYGSSISAEQVMMLRRLGIKRVTLFYDNDKAGWHANHVALGMLDVNCDRCEPIFRQTANRGRGGIRPARLVHSMFPDFLVSVVRYKEGDPKDPGDMNRRVIQRRIDDAVLIL